MTRNPLEQLQADVTAILRGNPATHFVPYSPFTQMVIQSVADEALAAWKVRVEGKAGLACLVMMPSLRVVTPNVPGPQYNVAIIVRTFDDPAVNNTHSTAEAVAMANLSWLDGVIIGGLTELHGDPQGEALKPNYSYPGMRVYDSTLTGPLPQDFGGRTADPTISISPTGLVTLSCADAEAHIYFSVDGSMPMPPAEAVAANNVPNLYSVPLAAPAGAWVRAVAWNPALLPSNVIEGQVLVS